jgi:hypothetical protein
MRLEDFRTMIETMTRDVPADFRRGIVAIEVSHNTIPHPLRGDVYTLGECIPLEWSGNGADLQSRVVLYHGSFAALARLGDFDWREEAWETLTHELRHHLEWRANLGALEAYDWAAEQNFARHEGEAFDPVFYRSGEAIAEGVWKVDDDVFLEESRGRGAGDECRFIWHGRRYRAALPAGTKRPAFLTLEHLADPPPGDVVLVQPRRSSLFDLVRRAPAAVAQLTVAVEPLDAETGPARH